MKKDRLRDDNDRIHNLDDLIEARAERTSHFAGDVDPLEVDVESPEDVDVDEALTFPHPKHKHSEVEGIELMDTPHEENMDEDWDAQDAQPTDYAEQYDEAIRATPSDDEEELIEDQVHGMGGISADEVSKEHLIEVMPSKFSPDEENDDIEPKNP